MSTTIRGIAASPGIAIAPLFVMRRPAGKTEAEAPIGAAASPEAELERYSSAVATARMELTALRDSTRKDLGAEKAAIFSAHLSILADPELRAAVESGVRSGGLSAGKALEAAAGTFVELLSAMEDDLFSARIEDIKDVVRRILNHLDGKRLDPWAGLKTESLVAAEDLSPSETRLMNPAFVKGFATAGGSVTSHSSILARSMRIPAVVGIGPSLSVAIDGRMAVVDGDRGVLVLDPEPGELAVFRAKQQSQERERQRTLLYAGRPSLSRDGASFELSANIGGLSDIPSALEAGAEGIGLFRTEFLYMDRKSLPTEDEQFRIYRHVLEAMAPRPVVIRTLDVGGDKEMACLPMAKEANPFLGLRAIRLCLTRPEIFRPQLRALLRAGACGRLRILFPMVAVAAELRRAKAFLEEERGALRDEGHDMAGRIEIGMMVEIPSAALMADRLAREVDFFSVGSNDLVQYTMAADRMNPDVAHLHQHLHPAMLRLIGPVAEAAEKAGIWCGVCGEMAADPLALPLLVGMGFSEFSMSATAIPAQRAVLAGIDRKEARMLYEKARTMDSAEEVREFVENWRSRAVGVEQGPARDI